MTLIDERERGWFHMDNAVIDEYLPRIGATAFAVYACIVRHSDRHGKAFPSYTTLQRELGTGRSQVATAIKKIVDAGLVTITAGARSQNVYHVVTVSTSPAEKLVPIRNQSRNGTGTSPELRPELVPNRDSNNTQVTRPKKQGTPPTPSPGVEYAAEFERAYLAYPKHEGKKEAHDVWQRKKPDIETVLAAIDEQKRGRKWREGYVMAFSRWLRGEHWDDEPTEDTPPLKPKAQADHNQLQRNPDGTPKWVG